MFGKKISKVQRRYAQLHGAKHYEGVIPIFDNEVQKHKNGFWMEFSIQPTKMSRLYKVIIIYVNGYQPYSYVISPNIIKISGDRIVPHLYSQENQRLCLTYPSFDEWTTDKLIANTYIPWIALWLYFYEDWLLSNEWKGGGIHPGDEIDTEVSKQLGVEKKVKKPKNRSIRKPVDLADEIYKERSMKFYEEVSNEVA